MICRWSLSDSKSQVTRTRLCILVDFNNPVVWMVLTRPAIFVWFRSCYFGLVCYFWWLYWVHRLRLVSPSLSCSIVPSALKQSPGTYHFFAFITFYSVVCWDRKVHYSQVPFLLLTTTRSDCISHSTNTLGKGMNPIILPPAMGK